MCILSQVVAMEARRARPRDISNTAWGPVTPRLDDVDFRECLQRIATEMALRIQSFDALDLAQVVWAMSTLELVTNEVLSGVAYELRRKDRAVASEQRAAGGSTSDAGPQVWATLYDLVPEYEHGMEPFIRPKIDELLEFCKSLAHPLSEEDLQAWEAFVIKLEVDNFGRWAGRQILDELGFWESEREFRKEAERQLESTTKVEIRDGLTSECKRMNLRVYCFASYSFLLSSGRRVEGQMQHCSGLLDGSDPPCNRLLRACALPLSRWIDRRFCAEFALLAEICKILEEEPGNAEGTIRIYAGYPLCTSCLGLVWQFGLQWPKISLEVTATACL